MFFQRASSITAITVFLGFLCSTFGQNTDAKPSDLPAKSQVGFSESMPYVPRDLPDVGKPVKAKKGAKNDNETSPIQNLTPSADRLLTIPVSVFTNNAAFLSGLQAADFSVFLQDKTVRVVSVEKYKSPLNIILLLDMSPSTDAQAKQMKLLANQVVEALQPEDQIMVAGFSNKLTVTTEFSSDRALIMKGLEKLKIGDGTSIYDNLTELIIKHKNGISGRTAIVLFTDGVDTTSRTSTYKMSLVAAEKSNITIYPVFFDTFEAFSKKPVTRIVLMPGAVAAGAGLIIMPPNGPISLPRNIAGPGMSKKEYDTGRYYLTDLLLSSGGRPIIAKDVLANNTKEMSSIPQELRMQYQLTFKLPDDRKQGERYQLKVRVNLPNLTVLTKGSYIEN